MTEKRKKKSEKQEIEKKASLEKKDNDKKRIELLYQKEKRKREKNETFNKKIAVLLASQEISRFFQNYTNQLTLIFDFMRSNIEIDKNLNFNTTHWQYKTYMFFTFYFDLIGSVLDTSDIQLIYRSVSKDIKLKERIPIGLIFFCKIFKND